MFLDASNSSNNHAVVLAWNVAVFGVAALGTIQSKYKRTYSLPLVCLVLIPASLWSIGVIVYRHGRTSDTPIEGEWISGIYYLWVMLGAPVLVCWLGQKARSKRPFGIDVLILVALAVSCLGAAWTALFGAASI